MKQFVATLFLFISFSEAFSQTCDPQQMQLYQVRAKDTDSNIDWELNRHHAFFNPSCSDQKNTLVVHLVGSFDNPSSTLKFPSLAANNGFHVVSLRYPNGTAAQTACGNSSDPDCYLKFRREILEGTDLSAEIEVNSDESVYNRLEKLLVYLNSQQPSEGWGQYLNGSDINWEKIIVSGHSQGGGHAAVIAMTKPVKRVLMFASPNDYSEFFSAAAPWTETSHLAVDSAYFGFNNINDDVVEFSEQFEAWDNLGMTAFGDSVKVDDASVPYNFSHQLYTDYDTTGIGGDHSVMILDSKTPVNSLGEPVFAPVWEYMLGLHGGPTSVRELSTEEKLFSIFPNPAISGNVRIRFSAELKGQKTISVFDALGRRILKMDSNSNEEAIINTQGWNRGLYFIKVSNSFGQNSIGRLIK